LSIPTVTEVPVASCPPSTAAAVCAGSDVGAIVARSSACAASWGQAPVQCLLWSEPADGEELVVFETPRCASSTEVERVQACADHIEVALLNRLSCDCSDAQTKQRKFSLPRDARPVVVVQRTLAPPCLPPQPDAGAPDAGSACAQIRISEDEAAKAFAAYKKQTVPGLNPQLIFTAREKTVPGLWESLKGQLFSGIMDLGTNAPVSETSFFYWNCTLTALGDSGPITSGVVADGAFYYSWSSGSGIFRSALGKLIVSRGSVLVKYGSPAYVNPGFGPPGLVVAYEGGQVVVYRATVGWAKFNEWQNPEYIGLLKDFGDHLSIMNGGKELPTTLP
jgi:hypothetical protein